MFKNCAKGDDGKKKVRSFSLPYYVKCTTVPVVAIG